MSVGKAAAKAGEAAKTKQYTAKVMLLTKGADTNDPRSWNCRPKKQTRRVIFRLWMQNKWPANAGHFISELLTCYLNHI
jgi:hypothetical protein